MQAGLCSVEGFEGFGGFGEFEEFKEFKEFKGYQSYSVSLLQRHCGEEQPVPIDRERNNTVIARRYDEAKEFQVVSRVSGVFKGFRCFKWFHGIQNDLIPLFYTFILSNYFPLYTNDFRRYFTAQAAKPAGY